MAPISVSGIGGDASRESLRDALRELVDEAEGRSQLPATPWTTLAIVWTIFLVAGALFYAVVRWDEVSRLSTAEIGLALSGLCIPLILLWFIASHLTHLQQYRQGLTVGDLFGTTNGGVVGSAHEAAELRAMIRDVCELAKSTSDLTREALDSREHIERRAEPYLRIFADALDEELTSVRIENFGPELQDVEIGGDSIGDGFVQVCQLASWASGRSISLEMRGTGWVKITYRTAAEKQDSRWFAYGHLHNESFAGFAPKSGRPAIRTRAGTLEWLQRSVSRFENPKQEFDPDPPRKSGPDDDHQPVA